jgi:hypothetical protein
MYAIYGGCAFPLQSAMSRPVDYTSITISCTIATRPSFKSDALKVCICRIQTRRCDYESRDTEGACSALMGTVFTSSQQVQFPGCVHLLGQYLYPHTHLRIIVSSILLRWDSPSFTSQDRDRDPYYACSGNAYSTAAASAIPADPPHQKMITESPREAGAKPALYIA